MAKKVLVYQMYPLAWSGIREMTSHLIRVKQLGADYVWLSPVYPSPRCDGGYDVADYFNIDYRLGTLRVFKEFVKVAHTLDLKVIMDLVLNHTSVEHTWFHSHPEYYCWSDTDRPGWHNLFDGGSAWAFHEARKKFYCHLFHPGQADLNWFPSGVLNRNLIQEFKIIMDFWMAAYNVDGFRIDAPQTLNKDFSKTELDIADLITGEHAVTVINALAHNTTGKTPFLMFECFDPSHDGSAVRFYTEKTDVEYVVNVLLKDLAGNTRHAMNNFRNSLQVLCKNPKFMLDLESHDAPRFTSRTGLDGSVILHSLFFDTESTAICLYQGQELGLKNPHPGVLPLSKILALDAQSEMRFESGKSTPEELQATSRANARVPLPLDEYARQELDARSTLMKARAWVREWKS